MTKIPNCQRLKIGETGMVSGGAAKMQSGEQATLTVRGKSITLPVHEDTFSNVFVDIRRVPFPTRGLWRPVRLLALTGCDGVGVVQQTPAHHEHLHVRPEPSC